MNKHDSIKLKKLKRRRKRTLRRSADYGDISFELLPRGIEVRDCIERRVQDGTYGEDACGSCNDHEMCSMLQKILFLSERDDDSKTPEDVSRDRDGGEDIEADFKGVRENELSRDYTQDASRKEWP